MDVKSYLENEKRGDLRQEYIAGTLREVADGGDIHFALRLNFAFLLKEHLSSNRQECRLYVGDMKVQVESAETFLYPDILVSCSDEDNKQNLYRNNPLLAAEVLTGESGAYDRGYKFSLYRQLHSLQEYILIESDYESVDCFRREGERWVLYSYAKNESLELPSLGFACDVEDIYQDILA